MGPLRRRNTSASSDNVSVQSQALSINSSYLDLSTVHPNTVRSLASAAPMLNPADKHFMRFYHMSSSLPIIATATGPLANLCNIVSICGVWRMNAVTGAAGPADYPWVTALNGVSLLLGCVSNVSLFLNFTGNVDYNISQIISIGGWYISSFLLASLLISTHFYYFDSPKYIPEPTYWHGVIAATLYFTGATLLLFNELGHILGHYPATFNLTPTQRRIMLLNVLCIAHLAVGGAIFQKLIGISYANAVYFSLVTILTIGFGDIVPNSTLGRALDIPYVYIGVILFGFTVASISVSVLEQHSETVYFYRLERSRLRALRKTAKAARGTDSELTDKDSFEIIKEIHHRESKRASIARSILGLASFAGFWLIGALVFSRLEGWTYFDSIYFTTFCFVTTGYGDFAPESNGGRPFFIVWAISAVPMMTIFISSLAEAVSTRLAQSGDKITHWSYLIYDYVWSFFPKPKHSSHEVIEEIDIDATPVDTEGELNIHKFADHVKKINIQSRIDRIIVLLKGVESFTETLIKEPDTVYTYEDWQLLHKIIQQTNPRTSLDDPVYWLSDRSPLRFPIVEPRFFLLSTLSALESEVKALGESENSKALSLLEDDPNGSQPGVNDDCDNENNDADESDSGEASSSPSSQISHSRPPSNPLVKFISPKFDRS